MQLVGSQQPAAKQKAVKQPDTGKVKVVNRRQSVDEFQNVGYYDTVACIELSHSTFIVFAFFLYAFCFMSIVRLLTANCRLLTADY